MKVRLEEFHVVLAQLDQKLFGFKCYLGHNLPSFCNNSPDQSLSLTSPEKQRLKHADIIQPLPTLFQQKKRADLKQTRRNIQSLHPRKQSLECVK
jgi:hypothetical protein